MVEKGGITGQIATILNPRELVINRGGADGVELGMYFRVLEPARAITDPTTSEDLGVIQREKVRVKVSDVHERFCIARTYVTYRAAENAAGLGFATAAAKWVAALEGAGMTRQVTKVKTLRASDYGDQWTEVKPEESIVKRGDPVEQIPGPSDEPQT